MDLEQSAQVYRYVADLGSPQRAAEYLGLPLETVRRHVEALERHVRERLFFTTRRGLEMSSRGTAVYVQSVRAGGGAWLGRYGPLPGAVGDDGAPRAA